MSETTTQDNDLITSRTLHHKNKILEGISKFGGNITRACKLAGVSTRTYYNYIEQDPDFKTEALTATQEAKESRLDEIQDSLYQQAVDPDKPSIIAGIFLAKCLGRTSQDPSRQFNDTPLQEIAEPETKALPLDATSDKLRNLMQIFVDTLPEAKPIEPASIQTQEKSQE